MAKKVKTARKAKAKKKPTPKQRKPAPKPIIEPDPVVDDNGPDDGRDIDVDPEESEG